MKKFNLKIFAKFLRLAKLYWLRKENTRALTLLVMICLLLIFSTRLSVSLNSLQGSLISSIAERNEPRFWKNVTIFLQTLIIYAPLLASFIYLQNKSSLWWRKWLNNHFLNKYLSQRNFYKLTYFESEIDNPDQRISEDVKNLCIESLKFLLVIIDSSLQIIAFSAVLWSISSKLVIFLVIYALLGTLVTTGLFGHQLVRLNYQQLAKEANFRFGLIRLRENAESIAFYGGESQENKHLTTLFKDVFDNFNKLILWQELYLRIFTNLYEFLPYLVPAIVVAPMVLNGNLEVGKISEATGAFMRVFVSLNIIVSRFESLTNLVAGINRLSSFYDFLESQDSSQNTISPDLKPTIKTIENDQLGLENITLQTPNYQRTLFRDICLNLNSGQGLLIRGASGCGKSSLLRAIAGLWNSGTGTIIRPKANEMLFLPQKPYMILGTLREQLIYPNVYKEISNERLQNILEQVNLPDLALRFGFNVKKDWSDILSLGEQQRIALARILISQPNYLILDEATSALDSNNEANFYEHLLQNKVTFISVGHRDSLKQYHQKILNLLEGGQWKLQ